MTPPDLPDPFSLVARALGCSREAISIDSAMYKDHGWDSFGHVAVILALEAGYGLKISDAEVEVYVNMRAIHQLYDDLLLRGGRDV